jgi:glycopeptide antibiotics resistance protein
MIRLQGSVSRIVLASYLVVLGLVVWSPISDDDGLLLGEFQVGPVLEKFLNLLMLMPMPVLVYWAFQRKSVARSLLLGPMVSAIIEVGQIWVPGRVPDFWDVGLNSTGYWGVLWLVRRGVFARLFG